MYDTSLASALQTKNVRHLVLKLSAVSCQKSYNVNHQASIFNFMVLIDVATPPFNGTLLPDLGVFRIYKPQTGRV